MYDSRHPPILRNKDYKRPSVFTPENLLREAKRQKALRDEDTSYHYLPAADYSAINPELRDMLSEAFIQFPPPIDQGACWTTDAPFRETASFIDHCRSLGILAVEMEAAALYAFAAAREKSV